MRVGRCLIVISGITLARGALLEAQICAGFPSRRALRYRTTVEAASYSYANSVGASFTTGGVVGGTLGISRTHDAENDASTFEVRIGGDADVSLNRNGRILLCPQVGVGLSFGPNDWLLTGRNYHSADLVAGIGVAAIPKGSGAVHLVATGGVGFALIRVSYQSSDADQAAGVQGWSGTDAYAMLSAAVGLTVGERWTVRPGLSVPLGLTAPNAPESFVVPFGREEGELSLSLSLGYSFGQRSHQP